ncbi:MAG: zinc ribbon domain-containing protein [bacterium]
MPIYEYVCQECGKKSSFLILKTSEPFTGKCEKCSSTKLRRVLSRFAAVRSEESRMERLADPSRWGDFDENDPKSLARFMKKMGQEMGEDLGEDFDQIVEEAEEEASSAPGTDEDDL